jgi:hypothetical protein
MGQISFALENSTSDCRISVLPMDLFKVKEVECES